MPKYIAEKLDLEVVDKRKFEIASGEVVEYPVSEAYIGVEDRGVTSLVVIGSNETSPLLGRPPPSGGFLGVTALELLGYQVDPVTKKLKLLELMLL
ncbi:MAG: hypothetical protein ACP5GI_08400 [Sulfolobales archaeon]